jgi:hypothetical protein
VERAEPVADLVLASWVIDDTPLLEWLRRLCGKRYPVTRAYEPSTIVELGSVEELTLRGCLFGRQWGGTDGWSNGPITISNCSS